MPVDVPFAALRRAALVGAAVMAVALHDALEALPCPTVAVIEGFAFPVASPKGSPVRYADAGVAPVTITSAAGAAVVAPITGTLRIAAPADRTPANWPPLDA